MDPKSQNPTPGASENSQLAKVYAAEALLRQITSDEPWVRCAQSYVDRLKQGLAVEPAAWESVRVGLGFVEPSPAREMVSKIVDLFQPQGEFDLNTTSFRIKRENLSAPFIECLEIFAEVTKKFVHYSGLKMGENLIGSAFQKSIAAEHLKEFIGKLRVLRDKIDMTGEAEADESLDALRLLIDRRIRQSGYTAAFIDLTEKSDPAERTKAFLQVDLADQLYERTLQHPALPAAFRNQVIGPQCSIPEMKLATLVEINATRSARDLDMVHLQFLEIMRDAGDSISGTGIPVKLNGRNATAALLPAHLKSIVQHRNFALDGLVKSMEKSGFARTPQGVFLSDLMTTLIQAGDLFVQTVDARNRGEHQLINQQIDVKTRRIGALIHDSRCPHYVTAFLIACCRNKAPIIPVQ